MGKNKKYKMKTKKAVVKRFRKSSTGKIKSASPGRGHLHEHKSRKRKRRLRKGLNLSPAMAANIRKTIPY